MKFLSTIFFISFALLSFSMQMSFANDLSQSMIYQQRGNKVNGIILTAILQKSAITPGNPIMLNITMQNDSEESKYYYSSTLQSEYNFIVTDESGHIINPLFSNKQYILSINYRELLPHQQFSDSRFFDHFYKLSHVGKYYITAYKLFFKADKQQPLKPDQQQPFYVVSNSIELTVMSDMSTDFNLDTSIADLPIVNQLPKYCKEYTVKNNEPVILNCSIKNISTSEQIIALGGISYGYIFTVQNFRGEIISALRNKHIKDEKRINYHLLPEKNVDSKIDLRTIYNYKSNERYFISVYHVVSNKNGKQFEIYSDSMIILNQK